MTAQLDPAARLALDTLRLIDVAVRLLPMTTKAKIRHMTPSEVDAIIFEIEHAALQYCGWLEVRTQ